ncbi:prolyl aminopeptidase [Amycolatopsis sp. NPDC052450]|uniref:prolyl aminopeptidase n=1 Tax=Amycolatopsis sp. NPDC052450 TaxID=3363937 RepID=UPI0037C8F282
MYPEIEPYASGHLNTGDGNLVYWEECGNPDGKPVVFLHGGPGGGCSPSHRRLFDPSAYRIVLFDQRGCGRSLPHTSASGDLSSNTTWHLVEDIERLRRSLGISRWQVFGGSWGSTLALAYAEKHPERVSELVLRGVFTLRSSELRWYYRGGAANVFPDLWEKFMAPIAELDGDPVELYAELLADPDPRVHGPAAVAWSTWEAATGTLLPRPELVAEFALPEFALAFARIENHYFVNNGWLEEGQLIRDAAALKDIPGVIVQGRYDLVTPVVSAWDLHKAWPDSELVIVPDAAHAYDEPGILAALLAATDRFRD